MTMGDRIAVLADGILPQVDSPRNLYNLPDNVFVAGFIGSPAMNFFDGTLVAEEGNLFVDTGDFRAKLPESRKKCCDEYIGKEVILGVRPEHIRVTSQSEEDAIPAEVYVLEPHSNELVLDLKMGDLIIKARDDKRELGFKPEVGQRVWIKLLQNAVHLFDKETEKRLT